VQQSTGQDAQKQTKRQEGPMIVRARAIKAFRVGNDVALPAAGLRADGGLDFGIL
jgi:hypothetical protein